jgi:hypothetical protein
MDDAAHLIIEDVQRSREIESVVAAPARSASRLDCGRVVTALNADGTRYRFEPRPALGASHRPATLENQSGAKNTPLGKEQIQDRVDHADLSSTQRAELIYFE